MKLNLLKVSVISVSIGFIILIIAFLLYYSSNPRMFSFSFFSISGFLLIFITGFYYIKITKNKYSFTFWLILIVVVIMIFLFIIQDSIFGMRIDEMSYDIATFY